MADPLDLLARDYRETTGALDVADHNRTWAQTFSSTPPTEVLRANQNYDELMATAIDQKMKLGSLTDKKQQELYFAQRMQPLKEANEIAQLRHHVASTLAAGATERFSREKDTQTMDHIVGFADYMEKSPPPDSPQYAPYLLQGVQKFPRMATTAWGKQTLGKLAEEHDTIQKLKDQIPPGFEMNTVEIGGGKQSHVTARKVGGGDDLHKEYGISRGQFDARASTALVKANPNAKKRESEPYVGANDGDLVKLSIPGSDGKLKSIVMPKDDFVKYGGKLAEDAPAAPAPAVDKKALAQQALNDPDASEVHKAAARKILGQ